MVMRRLRTRLALWLIGAPNQEYDAIVLFPQQRLSEDDANAIRERWMSTCIKGFAIDCVLGPGHEGPCISSSMNPNREMA